MIVTRMNDGFAFNAVDEAHNSMRLDIPIEQGGHGTGLRPMQTLLSALGACSGVDIVMILNKQKETIEFFYCMLAKLLKNYLKQGEKLQIIFNTIFI